MRNATILVVEDDRPILNLIVSYLENDGYTVYTAIDGESALKQVRSVRPDLIVLDVMLPGVDGLEVCRRVQQECDVYVLMLTARAKRRSTSNSAASRRLWMRCGCGRWHTVSVKSAPANACGR